MTRYCTTRLPGRTTRTIIDNNANCAMMDRGIPTSTYHQTTASHRADQSR